MPRIAITVTLVDDVNRPLASENWSPLGYEDLGNPTLSIEGDTLVNNAERNLLDRLRTSIDRTLLTFARRERRRWGPRPLEEAQPNPVEVIDQVAEDNSIYQAQYLGEFSPPPEPDRVDQYFQQLPLAITESQRMALIADQQMVEDQRVKPIRLKRARQVKRVSRYKREPVI